MRNLVAYIRRRRKMAVAGLIGVWAAIAASPSSAEWRTTVFVAGDASAQLVSVDADDASDGAWGWAVTAVAGVETLRDFAVMGELSYGQAEITESGEEAEGDIFQAFAIGHYRIPIAGRIRPYVGGGFGYTIVQGAESDANGPAFKLLAGVDGAVGEWSSVYFQVDYIRSLTDDGGADIDLTQTQIRVGYKRRF